MSSLWGSGFKSWWQSSLLQHGNSSYWFTHSCCLDKLLSNSCKWQQIVITHYIMKENILDWTRFEPTNPQMKLFWVVNKRRLSETIFRFNSTLLASQITEYRHVAWWIDGVSSISVSSLGLVSSLVLIPILLSGRDFKRLVTFLLIMETISVGCSLAEALRVLCQYYSFWTCNDLVKLRIPALDRFFETKFLLHTCIKMLVWKHGYAINPYPWHIL